MFVLVLQQVVKMFLLLAVGYTCSRTGLISEEGTKGISNLLLMVVNPLLLFESFLVDRTERMLRDFFLSLLLALIAYLISAVIAYLTCPKSRPGAIIERFSIMYPNCGFMGIPLIQAVLGSKGVFYLTPYIVVFNVLAWTHGLFLMTGKSDSKQLRKGLTTPAMIGVALGFCFFLGNLRLPKLVDDTISYLTAVNTPVAMLVAGLTLAQSDLRHCLSDPRIYLVSFIKLLAVPLVVLLVFLPLPVDPQIRSVILIAAATPAAATGTMFAIRYHQDYRYASAIFAFSTLIGLVTIPLMVFVIDHTIIR